MDVFPFFVGNPRSGTTLLRAMFDSHSEMAVPWESFFILSLATKRDRYEKPEGFATDLFIADLMGTAFEKWKLSPEAISDALASPPPDDYPDAIRRIYAYYTRLQGKTRYADKTPTYVRSLPLLAHLFPESRFVHIIRDGRDVALSTFDTLGWNNPEQVTLSWKRHVQDGRRAGRTLGRDRYLEVRYEHLVDEPELVVREICGFIDLPFDPAMLCYHERADEVLASEPYPRRHQRLRLPLTKGLRDWRQHMSGDNLALFELLGGDLLEELGYELALVCPFPAQVGAVWPFGYASRSP